MQSFIEENDLDGTPELPEVPRIYMRPMLEQLDKDIASIDAICHARDVQALQRWAHKLSGGLSIFGDSMLLYTCQELLSVLEALATWFDEVDAFIDCIRAEIVELRGRLDTALQA
jgi:two-component system, NarL family, capsular synthesis sensor histidine kinase RcsC